MLCLLYYNSFIVDYTRTKLKSEFHLKMFIITLDEWKIQVVGANQFFSGEEKLRQWVMTLVFGMVWTRLDIHKQWKQLVRTRKSRGEIMRLLYNGYFVIWRVLNTLLFVMVVKILSWLVLQVEILQLIRRYQAIYGSILPILEFNNLSILVAQCMEEQL